MATTQTESHDGTDVKTVEEVDSEFKCGTEAPAQVDGGVPKWFGLCVDGSKCGRDATRLVEVGGVSILTCGHHVDEAAEAAAEAAGVELATREPSTEAPEGDDYDVSDTLDALAERADDADDLARCDDCETAVVPDGDGGHVCPSCGEPRSAEGRVPATDGGTVATGATTDPVPPKARKFVAAHGGSNAGKVEPSNCSAAKVVFDGCVRSAFLNRLVHHDDLRLGSVQSVSGNDEVRVYIRE